MQRISLKHVVFLALLVMSFSLVPSTIVHSAPDGRLLVPSEEQAFLTRGVVHAAAPQNRFGEFSRGLAMVGLRRSAAARSYRASAGLAPALSGTLKLSAM